MSVIQTRLLIFWLSLKWMFIICLRDHVWHEGEKWIVTNGVSGWTLHRLRDDFRKEHVPRDQVRKVWTPANCLRSFKSGHRFYMQSWYRIWRENGIEPWMRGCRIWGSRKE